MALVVDEFGDVTGLVTLQDLLDEFLEGMGAVACPLDLCRPFRGGVRVQGLVEIDDLRRWTGIALETSGAKTVGGLVTTVLDSMATNIATIAQPNGERW